MKAFNLKQAIKGEPLVTESGRKVTDFTYFKKCNSVYNCVVLLNEKIESYTSKGEFHINRPSILDLKMVESKEDYKKH